MDAILGIVLEGSAYMTLGLRHRAVDILTTSAWTGSGDLVPSAMAKAGVLAMTRSLAAEWGGRGVRLNAIALSPLLVHGSGSLPQRILHANSRPAIRSVVLEITASSRLASFLLADQTGYINGEVVTIYGGEC